MKAMISHQAVVRTFGHVIAMKNRESSSVTSLNAACRMHATDPTMNNGGYPQALRACTVSDAALYFTRPAPER